MPIAGNTLVQPGSRKAYFDSLYQLDAWITNPDQKPEGILPYVPRNQTRDPRLESRGKLLVCHDFKGGYNESPFSLSYTFNFWSMNDIFVYFSHHLVTVPPPAWIHAAHRHGTKILGVLLFEHQWQGPDLHLLLSGTSAPLGSTSFSPSLYYLAALADLASQRGFDGYLLNFELSVSNNAAQALVGWVRNLREELWKKVGPHAEVIWYDSVITTGKVSYQNKLNEHNLPYFLASTGLYSNYWWRPDYPHDTLEYFYSLDTNLLNTRAISPSVPSGSLTHQDVFMGIDVFGRNTFGGGGFDTHLALEVISPDGLGLGAALFAPGWTWESRQDDAGRTWEKWWKEELTFWTGNVLGLDLKSIKPQGSHTNEYRPVGHYFKPKPPPDPRVLPFFSTFSPGSGRAWWVEGERVWNGPMDKGRHWTVGWLDIDKQSSVGDLVWPVPTISRNLDSGNGLGQPLEPTPVMQVLLNFDEAWNGGSSLKFLLSEPLQKEQVQHKQSLWMPVQSLSLTPGQNYTATAVYKTNSVKAGVVPNIELTLRSSDPFCDNIKVEVVSENKSLAFSRNWTGLRTTICVASITAEPVTLALGFTFDIEREALVNPECFSFSLGQVNVYASDRDGQENGGFQATFTSAHQDQDGMVQVPALKDLDGILTWEAPSSHTSPSILERYAYWNIYIQHISSSDEFVGTEKPRDAVWIGTSGPDYCGEKSRLGRFVVLGKNITSCISVHSDEGTLRFYIQGVTECGETNQWQNVIQTDVKFKIQGNMLARIKQLALK